MEKLEKNGEFGEFALGLSYNYAFSNNNSSVGSPSGQKITSLSGG